MKSIDLCLAIPLVTLVFPCAVYSATIYVPGDVASVTEAIEVAVSGDTIQLTETTVFVGQPLEVRDKDIVLRGPSKENRALLEFNASGQLPTSSYSEPAAPTILVENAQVTLEFVQIDSPFMSRFIGGSTTFRIGLPIQVMSGSLAIEGCVLHCSVLASAPLRIERCQITGYSERTPSVPPYPAGNDYLPPVSVVGPMNGEIVLLDSTLAGDHCPGLALHDLTGVTVRVEDCQIVGGMPSGPRWFSGVSGIVGMTVSNCQELRLEMTGSTVQGTEGGWGGCCSPYRVLPMGNGLDVSDSTLVLWGGEFRGGLGSAGLVHVESPGPIFHTAGIGGNGLVLQNSHVNVRDAAFVPGEGHEPYIQPWSDTSYDVPGGEPGEAVVMDETSTLTYDSGVEEWEWYSPAPFDTPAAVAPGTQERGN